MKKTYLYRPGTVALHYEIRRYQKTTDNLILNSLTAMGDGFS